MSALRHISAAQSAPEPVQAGQVATPYMGLAPFLRMSIAGIDLQPLAQQLLERAQRSGDDANLWMNLSIAMLCLGQREHGLAIQAKALQITRHYHISAAQQPAKLRLLMLMAPGDVAANTPLECLLEHSDVDLDLYYLSDTHADALWDVPSHDVLVVALSEAQEHRRMLLALEQTLARWPKPVINAPQHIPRTGRAWASALLQGAPGLLIAPTLHLQRVQLQATATGDAPMPERDDCDFPLIVRPMGSHAGRDLDRVENAPALAAYLERVAGDDFFVSRFIDYSDEDALFRKFRIALIDGQAFACHMAVSSHWMVHYVNAGMYEDANKRAQEAQFMAQFAAFEQRHRLALKAIYERTELDYLCIDCAQTRSGELLVFEIDHAMVVHAMDSEQLFAHKQTHMQKVKAAFRDALVRRVHGHGDRAGTSIGRENRAASAQTVPDWQRPAAW
ncbi:MAG: hypothetical protein WCH44_16225 [Betaproteobacteria bacterium]